jgi:hypothetical protein
LHGYHECLVRLGRDAEAVIVKSLLQLAQAEADVPVGSSCLCRLGNPSGCTEDSNDCKRINT